jgi:flagellar protein FlgJ
MTPRQFYNAYSIFAKESQAQTGVPYLFTLAQAALESAYGSRTAGPNNFFGIKDTDGVNGNETLVLTTEYNRRTGLWTKIKQYFRKYKTPADSFTDHGKFLRNNKRYAKAFRFQNDPYSFAWEVAQAGYATDPKYYQKIVGVMKRLQSM